jgi:ADP-heptose:LPS heptosyltransferase
VVFTTPLVRAMRQRYPDAHITYAVESAAAAVVTGNPHLDDVLVVPKRRGIRRLVDDMRLGRSLRRRRFDLVVDLHGGPRASWLTWATGAPARIGYLAPGRAWMYTQTVPRPDDRHPRHAVTNQWELLAALGIPHGSPAQYPLEMPDVPDADARVGRILATAGMTPGGPLVVLHVSAGNRFRRWPADHFVVLVTALARRDPRRRFVLTSGPSDAPAAEALVRRIASSSALPAGAVVHAQFTVEELRALASRASLYIGGDSGPLHVAATTRTPIVALFGSTLPERSMPWRGPQWFAEAVDAGPLPCRPCRQRTCTPGDFRCLTRIAPERVEAAAERALQAAVDQSRIEGARMESMRSSGETDAGRAAHL